MTLNNITDTRVTQSGCQPLKNEETKHAHSTMLRRPEIQTKLGIKRSTIYTRITQGLITKPVNLGGRTVGWPSHEIDQIYLARIAGMTDEEIFQLVQKLENARKN